jgi:plastocyanin
MKYQTKIVSVIVVTGLVIIASSCKNSTKSTLPILSTVSISAITPSGATSGGNISDDGGADITARGVCWGTATNPVSTGSHTTDGIGAGTFSSSLTGLTAGTLYYVRAYATNSVGTAYGNEVSFTTTAASLAILTTTAASTITATTAASGGNITDDSGSNITEKGVCWSTSTSPTILDPHTTDGPGKGVFTSAITGLTKLTTYYVRAYATNSAGTAYGNELSFITIDSPGVNEVWIQNFGFNPVTITVAAGTTITWTNKDNVAHTVTSTTGIFDSGSFGTNGTYVHTFSTAGNFPYYCTIHPYMTGTVIVN